MQWLMDFVFVCVLLVHCSDSVMAIVCTAGVDSSAAEQFVKSFYSSLASGAEQSDHSLAGELNLTTLSLLFKP
jgi:hypothetical protein